MTAASDPANPDDFSVSLDSEGLRTASVRGSMLTGVSQLIKLFLQVGSQVALARLLFPADFGLVAIVYPVVAFISLFADIGFGEAVVQRHKLDQAQVSALFWTNFALSVALALLIVGISPLVGRLYNEPRIIPLLCVTALGVPVGALGGVQAALIVRQMQFSTIVRIEIIAATITTGTTIVLAWFDWSYWALVTGALLGQSAAALMNWGSSGWRPSKPRRSDKLVDDLKFGGNVTGFNLAMFLTQSGDNIIVGLANGQYALGLYDRSYRLVVQPVGQVLAPIGRVAIPLLSRLKDDELAYRKAFLLIVRLIVILACPGMLVCVMLSEDIVHLLLGPRWHAASPIFHWIAVGGVTSILQAPSFWLFISQARMKALRSFTLMTSATNLTAFMIGSFWGVLGVAIMNALVGIVVTTPMTVYGATEEGAIRRSDLLLALWPMLLACGASVAALFFYRDVAPSSKLATVIGALLISYLIFIGAAAIRADDRASLRTGLASLRHPTAKT